MKKILALILAILMMLLSSCSSAPEGPGDDPIIDPHIHRDVTGDGLCDICSVVVECPHDDYDGDNLCDYCDISMLPACTVHSDTNGDGKCDSCQTEFKTACREHNDTNGDGKCDACDADVTIVCTEHTDANKDGSCDVCKISVVIILDFYAVNDTHGKLASDASFTGVDELTTYLKNEYKSNDNTILLSSGDMWQGHFASNLTGGLIMTEWMNDLDFVSMTIGNHEFDWGIEYIERNSEIAEFPFLAINIYDRATGKRADFCQPSVMVERSGVKIGIIGAVGDCYSSTTESMVASVEFKVGAELTALVKAEAERLRAAGAEFIVYSIHDGAEFATSSITNVSSGDISSYYDTSLSNGYVDLVFEGHTHQKYILCDNYGVYHLQTNGDDKGVSHVEISLNYVADEYSVNTVRNIASGSYQGYADDPIVEQLLNKYSEQLADAYVELGTNNSYRNSSDISNLVAMLEYNAGMQKWGEQYDIVLGGGYLSVRSPYCINSGTVYYGDLINVLPFDNDIVLCSISGYKLWSQFFNTTNSRYHIYYEAYGSSIKQLLRDGIDKNATYYVITDSYSLEYEPNGLTYVDTLAPNTYARDLVAQYIMAGGLGTGVSGGNTGGSTGGNTGNNGGSSAGNTSGGDVSDYEFTSIATILEMLEADEYKYNVETEEFYVKATIVSLESNWSVYGNCIVRDENGDEIYVYGIWDMEGTQFQYITADKPDVGDTVILRCSAKYYKNNSGTSIKKELVSSRLVAIL